MAMVEEINQFFEASAQIALVYDANGCYAYDGVDDCLLSTNTTNDTSRAVLPESGLSETQKENVYYFHTSIELVELIESLVSSDAALRGAGA